MGSLALMGISRSESERLEIVCKEIHDSSSSSSVSRVIRVVMGLNQVERRNVGETYMRMYGDEDVIENEALRLMMVDPFERDAAVARKALDQHNLNVIIEIYTCRKSSHVLLIQQVYHEKYRTHLDLDIASIEPPHPLQKILLALSASHKAHHAETSEHIAKCDAKRLYETGEGKGFGIDEAVLLETFSKRSVAQLNLTFRTYTRIYGHTYTRFLKNVECGGLGDAVRSVAKCICNPPRYYAKVLYGWFKGKTKDEGAIVRVMLGAGVAPAAIETQLKKKYGVELKTMICESIPQGNHRDLLLAIATT